MKKCKYNSLFRNMVLGNDIVIIFEENVEITDEIIKENTDILDDNLL